MAKKISKKKIKKKKLNPDLAKSIWAIFLIVLAVLSILSFFDKAGAFGELVQKYLANIAGWGMYLVPLFLLGVSAAFILSWKKATEKSIIFSSLLFFSSLLGMFAISNYEEAVIRGGYWGFAFSWVFVKFFGAIGAFVVLFALALIAIIVGFHLQVDKVFNNLLERRRLKKSSLELKIDKKFKKDKKEKLTNKEAEEETQVSIKDYQTDKPDEEGKDKKGNANKKAQDAGIISPLSQSSEFKDFKLPNLDLLDEETGKPTSGDIVANANIIKRTLQNFGIDVEMSEVNVGPTVTQYTLKPAEGVKLARITALNNDLSLALAAHPIRIEAPIPGRSLVGIEIPNKVGSQVRLGSLLANEQFKATGGNLIMAIGRDVRGTPIYADLSRMPHLLVAGATGTGKTIALNALLLSLIYRNPPHLLRFILIDPKRVEFSVYEGIPHLLAPIIIDNNKAVNALKWVVGEMERRFEILHEAKARDIHVYNNYKKVVQEGNTLPYIAVVIDELADLMSSKGREVEALIVRIAQMARAVGIHLVLATQRPSVEVITGLIKANITARMAFQVASQVDSRTILDMAGAEKLLGNGDMLFLTPEKSKPFRVQGAYINEKEVKRVVQFLREQKIQLQGDEDENDIGEDKKDITGLGQQPVDFDSMEAEADDELYNEAKDLIIKKQQASASYLQRMLRIGYARAARLLDMLEENGVVGPGEGAKPRDVYVQYEEDEDEYSDDAEI